MNVTTLLTLRKKHRRGEPITMLTAYDYSSARLVDAAGIDMILVGDSLGMTMMGLDTTVPVTIEEMLHHCRMVARAAKNAFLVGDLPFGSYEVSPQEAVTNALRFLKEAGMHSVKLEGGKAMSDTVQAIVTAGVPVMGHIGLTPQTVSMLGGFRVQGKTAKSAQTLLEDALALQEAGCFAVVLEAIPAGVAQVITQKLDILTIGIGAGAGCSGQVLVYHDILGLSDSRPARFVKPYANLSDIIVSALETYRAEVKSGVYPAGEHTYPMKQAELEKFLAEYGEQGAGSGDQ